MIWLTWRQFRLQALVLGIAVAVLGGFLAVTGPGLAGDYQQYAGGFLKQLQFDRINTYLYSIGQVLVYAAPPVIGAFWGAPLIARELEAGTHRLVWNQSISRTRWLVTKLAVTGLSAITLTGLLSLAVTWWSDPIDDAIGAGQAAGVFEIPRMLPPVFGARGVVPIGYAAFAFALGVAVGLVVRRSVVAIAVTLAAVIAIQVLSPLLLRPHLMTPLEASVVVTPENMRGLQLSGPEEDPQVLRIEAKLEGEGFWKLSERTVNSAGQVQKTLPSYIAECGPPGPRATEAESAGRPPMSRCLQRLADDGYRQQISYHPASRFWDLQWREFGLFLLLATGLTGFCFWRIRRDLT
ncbi:ABC transporter permease subunit [Kribbella sp. CA-293567]|uniref:ABC transporter permease subunit n=1 Tax=Kribbella sp. CA-293567 TaxID=3002436 RepID=UPI0022DE5BE9|nr:ABC transporter permease subunit [Kribbella sp. CA-293567]WBQ06621.1 ABC transporter permease subunit [Kribbella sp. CA-293567]